MPQHTPREGGGSSGGSSGGGDGEHGLLLRTSERHRQFIKRRYWSLKPKPHQAQQTNVSADVDTNDDDLDPKATWKNKMILIRSVAL